MAEFTEVMKQAKRMCKSYGVDCGPCKLHKKYGLCPLCAQSDDHVPMDWCLKSMPEIERIVMDWAAANPEPRYPSWIEAWKQLFPDGQRTPCPGCCGRKYAPEWCGREECGKCKNRPIPADIAEKLGIKPIGGDENG